MSLFPVHPLSSYLIKFNAGKCTQQGNLLKPDMRKGTIYMDQSDDQLMHFYWKERKASHPEDDLIIFPDEAELTRVTECTTGRVYLLKFKSSSQSLLFWMQDKDSSKDEQVVARVNHLINHPHQAMEESHSPLSSTMDLGEESSSDLMRMLGENQDINVTPDHLLQFLQTAGGYGGAVPVASTPGGDGPIESITSHLLPGASSALPFAASPPPPPPSHNPTHTAHTTASLSQPQPEALDQLRSMLANVTPGAPRPSLQLSDVLTPSALQPLLNDREISRSLFPFLPDTLEHTEEEVRQVVASPQFQQSLQSLSGALESGQLGPLLGQLGLDSSAGQSVEAFLRAVERQARDKEQQGDAMEE
ncbi:proteasome complex subunit Rpn13 ubiquitin receptor-domain-containing protein [Spinellus fusiger]|nr:proteasome complex subunit Rpn13 ubiquitin receptor-domain-containing protein [Spinellus fusiger]